MTERYTVEVCIPGRQPTVLLVPISPQITVGQFLDVAVSRARRQIPDLPTQSSATVHLFSDVGPLVDSEDRLQDVVVAPAIERIYLVFASFASGAESAVATVASGPPSYQDSFMSPSKPAKPPKDATLVRIITPSLARVNQQTSQIIPISSFTNETLWREIVFAARQHLSLSGEDSSTLLDLYTAEVLVEPSSYDLTARDLRLQELAIDGVLSLYAVVRKKSALPTDGLGADAVFSYGSGLRWYMTTRQSERGLAAFLSTLRVFGHLISAKQKQEHQQEAILRTIHALFRFPPALNAFRALMDGKSLSPPECSAMIQVCFQLLQEMIQLPIIKRNRNRMLEGSRLLFGFILHKAAGQVAPTEDSPQPFLASYTTFDLKDTITELPVRNPVQTPLGLMERATFELRQSAVEEIPLDRRTARLVVSTGGIKAEVSYFDLDRLTAIGVLSTVSSDVVSDLVLLSTLCEEYGLAVCIPSSLANAKAPCLTVDQEGFLGVYTGRTPCGTPGKDFQVFRPLEGREFEIDPALVTQAIQPILEARRSEGTSMFELIGESRSHAVETPDELLMFCLDCSKSMKRASFDELNDEDAMKTLEEELADVFTDATNIEDLSFQAMREFLTEHESYSDFIGIVRDSAPGDKTDRASEVIMFLATLLKREMEHHAHKINNANQKIINSKLIRYTAHSEFRLARLGSLVTGLDVQHRVLADFLMFKAQDSVPEAKIHWWSKGEAVPEETTAGTVLGDKIDDPPPHEFLCPISHELMWEDPVVAPDGFTYSRTAIKRWFQIRHSSPSTGLPLHDTTLRRNEELFRRIDRWKSAADVIEVVATSTPTLSTARSSARATGGLITLNISGPNAYFVRRVPLSMTVSDLYKVVFRGLQGTLDDFELFSDGTRYPRTELHLRSTKLRPGSMLLARPVPRENYASTSGMDGQTRPKSLVKLFKSSGSLICGYWISNEKPLTFASVLFRYWRFLLQSSNRGYRNALDVGVWTNLRPKGDDSLVGDRHESWDDLSTLLITGNATGSLGDETLTEESSRSLVSDQPLVLKIGMFTYESGKEFERRTQREKAHFSRLDTAKHVFGAFINRSLAYGFATHMGLVTFGSKTDLSQKLSGVVEDFRSSIMRMEAEGDTALWDAIDFSITHMLEYIHERELKNVRKRVVILSDGSDNQSNTLHNDLALRARNNGIVLDSICIGDDDRLDLMRLCQATGGYKFWPQTVEAALGICELEPFLSLGERPTILQRDWKRKVKEDVVTREDCPARKTHPNLSDDFVQIAAYGRSQPKAANSTPSNNRNARLLSEIRSVAANLHPHYDVYISEANMGFWKVVMQGPPGTPYETGTFLLYLDMGERYPLFAPSGRFITPVYHPNINRHGRICHSIFSRNWTSDTTNIQVINVVYSLLLDPEFTDPINTAVTLDFHWDQVAFGDEVRAHIRRHATKTREQHKREIEGVAAENRPAGQAA